MIEISLEWSHRNSMLSQIDHYRSDKFPKLCFLPVPRFCDPHVLVFGCQKHLINKYELIIVGFLIILLDPDR